MTSPSSNREHLDAISILQLSFLQLYILFADFHAATRPRPQVGRIRGRRRDHLRGLSGLAVRTRARRADVRRVGRRHGEARRLQHRRAPDPRGVRGVRRRAQRLRPARPLPLRLAARPDSPWRFRT